MLTNEDRAREVQKQTEKQLLQSIAYDMDAIRDKVSVITTIMIIYLIISAISIFIAMVTTAVSMQAH